MAFSGIAFGLPFAMNSAEGTEASMFVAAAGARSSWKRAMVAVAAAAVSLLPIAGLLWVIFHFVGASYLDYAIAVVVFLLGLRAIREGLKERPIHASAGDPGAAEPMGLAPASAESIREFQRAHGIAATGEIGPSTQASIHAVRREHGYDAVDAYVLGTDVADPAAVRDFQCRHGLNPSGRVDAATRGALRVAQQQGVLDGSDPDEVRRFQRSSGIAPSGRLDRATDLAAHALEGEGATTIEGPDGDGTRRVDPLQALGHLDPADEDSVSTFQRSLGLAGDGIMGAETRGAILALRARLRTDPSVGRESAGGARGSQGPNGISVDVIEAPGTGEAHSLTPDPIDEEAVRSFQRLYGLSASGVVDGPTRQAIRHARDWWCDVDVTDPTSIERFQETHGLMPDAVIGLRTQAALRATRAERYPADEGERHERYGDIENGDGARRALRTDVADPDAVKAFQSDHHLVDDGVVGPATRQALAVTVRHRIDGGQRQGDHGALSGGKAGPVERLRDAMGGAWPAYVGVVLETSEALLYSFAVASSSLALAPAIIGAAAGFSWPWALLPAVKRVMDRIAEWKQEFTIGLILVGVSTSFGILHAAGVFR